MELKNIIVCACVCAVVFTFIIIIAMQLSKSSCSSCSLKAYNSTHRNYQIGGTISEIKRGLERGPRTFKDTLETVLKKGGGRFQRPKSQIKFKRGEEHMATRSLPQLDGKHRAVRTNIKNVNPVQKKAIKAYNSSESTCQIKSNYTPISTDKCGSPTDPCACQTTCSKVDVPGGSMFGVNISTGEADCYYNDKHHYWANGIYN
jgi:hypothetical protein